MTKADKIAEINHAFGKHTWVFISKYRYSKAYGSLINGFCARRVCKICGKVQRGAVSTICGNKIESWFDENNEVKANIARKIVKYRE